MVHASRPTSSTTSAICLRVILVHHGGMLADQALHIELGFEDLAVSVSPNPLIQCCLGSTSLRSNGVSFILAISTSMSPSLSKHKKQGWKLQNGGKGTGRLDAKGEMAEAESLKRRHFAIVAGTDSCLMFQVRDFCVFRHANLRQSSA